MLRFAKKTGERGDTLIEVLFAVTVFSFIVVAALNLMNQGVSSAQRSLEITSVRQQIDGQAEVLRFLHESYIEAYKPGITFAASDTSPAAQYSRLIQFVQAGGRTAASKFGSTPTCVVPSDSAKDFIMNPVSATLVTTTTNPGVFKQAPTFAQLTYTSGNVLSQSQGIWVEAVRSTVNGTEAGYIDFHIRACWNAPGQNLPMNLGTIVRLYEPRG